MKIAIGNDHAAVEMKKEVVSYLEEKGYTVVNLGTDTTDSVDYPLIAEKVTDEITSGRADQGVLICGTGIGMSLAANKVPGIRCAAVSEPVSARLAKQHNNANIIAFGARIVGMEEAKAILDAFLESKFLGGRHARRVDEIRDLEKKYNK